MISVRLRECHAVAVERRVECRRPPFRLSVLRRALSAETGTSGPVFFPGSPGFAEHQPASTLETRCEIRTQPTLRLRTPNGWEPPSANSHTWLPPFSRLPHLTKLLANAAVLLRIFRRVIEHSRQGANLPIAFPLRSQLLYRGGAATLRQWDVYTLDRNIRNPSARAAASGRLLHRLRHAFDRLAHHEIARR